MEWIAAKQFRRKPSLTQTPRSVGERPLFRAALATLKAGDTLIIWKMDRAFRSLLQVLEELEARGVEFHP